VFTEPTINDFVDNIRWHLAKALDRARGEVVRIKSEHASRGILQSSMTIMRIFAEVRKEFDAGIETALGELKRAMRKTQLDGRELREVTVQCLENFAIQAKAVTGPEPFRSLVGEVIDQNLRAFDQHLKFILRQFDVGFFDPNEPEVPQVSNAINVGSMVGSAIQQSSPGAKQRVEITLNVESVTNALAGFESAIATAG